jgi:N-glycosidase YbiA
MAIYFYGTHDPHGCFSNFARYPVRIAGKEWPTSEHYFQAMKFKGTPHEGEVRRAPSPGAAARVGRDRRRPLRGDWESVKDGILRAVVLAKFEQHDDIREVLLGTGDEELIEHTENDRYWADGGDGSGKNMLGITLMSVRAELRARCVSVGNQSSDVDRPGRG